MTIDEIKFDEKGLVPAIAQEASTGEVLMLACMNKEAVEKTLSTGRAHYFSRSRKRLWLKGETSGNFQDVESVYYDCDADAILLLVRQTGVACHTGERTCFFRRLDKKESRPPMIGFNPMIGFSPSTPSVITEVYKVILERKKASPEKSYVASLYAGGLKKIAAKIEEEAKELIEAAEKKDKKEIVRELADLWFHTLVLLGYKDIDIEAVYGELSKRFGVSGIEEKKSREKK